MNERQARSTGPSGSSTRASLAVRSAIGTRPAATDQLTGRERRILPRALQRRREQLPGADPKEHLHPERDGVPARQAHGTPAAASRRLRRSQLHPDGAAERGRGEAGARLAITLTAGLAVLAFLGQPLGFQHPRRERGVGADRGDPASSAWSWPRASPVIRPRIAAPDTFTTMVPKRKSRPAADSTMPSARKRITEPAPPMEHDPRPDQHAHRAPARRTCRTIAVARSIAASPAATLSRQGRRSRKGPAFSCPSEGHLGDATYRLLQSLPTDPAA